MKWRLGIEDGKLDKAHAGLFKIINEIKKEVNEVETEIEKIIRGQQAPKMRKKDEDREISLQTIIASRNSRTTMQFFRGIAHNLVL
jgi:Sec-independent protein translocase protein TatA